MTLNPTNTQPGPTYHAGTNPDRAMKPLNPRQPLTIFVVEDTREDYEVIEKALHGCCPDHTIHHCKTGEACMEALEACPARHLPSLIVLDLNLPCMSGWDVLETIRASSVHRHIPVLLLTTSSNPRDVIKSYCAGANSYQVKPFRTPDFLELVSKVAGYWTEVAVLPAGEA